MEAFHSIESFIYLCYGNKEIVTVHSLITSLMRTYKVLKKSMTEKD